MEEAKTYAVNYFPFSYFEDEIVLQTYLYPLSLFKTGNWTIYLVVRTMPARADISSLCN